MEKALVVCLLLSSSLNQAYSARGLKVVHRVPWDPRMENEVQFGTIHSIDVHINQYMDMFCPQYDADAKSTLEFIIYNVSERSFNDCTLTQDASVIFKCDSPNISKKFTVKFQKRSPNPLGFKFNPGHTYHYMAFVYDGNTAKKHECNNALRLAVIVHHKLPRPYYSHSQLNTGKPRTTTSLSKSSSTTKTTKVISSTSKSILIEKITKEAVATPGGLGGSGQLQCSIWWILLAVIVTHFLNR